MLLPEEMKNQMKMAELAEKIMSEKDMIKIDDYIKDVLDPLEESNPGKIEQTKETAIFLGITEEKLAWLKQLIKTVKSSVSLTILGLHFPKESYFMEEGIKYDKYDVLVSGKSSNVWPFLLIFDGMWLAEYLTFRYDPEVDGVNIHNSYKKEGAWTSEKYIDKELIQNVKELIELSGHNPIHIPMTPNELHTCKKYNWSYHNISAFKVEMFRMLKNYRKAIELKESFKGTEDLYLFIQFVIMHIKFEKPLHIDKNGYFIPPKLIKNTYDKAQWGSGDLNKNFILLCQGIFALGVKDKDGENVDIDILDGLGGFEGLDKIKDMIMKRLGDLDGEKK